MTFILTVHRDQTKGNLVITKSDPMNSLNKLGSRGDMLLIFPPV